MAFNTSNRSYRTEVGDTVRIYRSEYNGRMFYKIMQPQKDGEGNTVKFYKEISFKKGVEVQDKTDIKILKMMENLRKNPKDPYHPISSLLILEFEIQENREQQKSNAQNDFQIDLATRDTNKEYEIKDEDLPF